MKKNKDNLGNRMKSFYENITKYFLPRRTYTIIRIDGKAFLSYTKGLEKPFDKGFIEDMNETASFLCSKIQGAKCAYVQSDEISLLLTDFDDINTCAWFDGNIQKISSVSASLATGRFNHLRYVRHLVEMSDITNGYLTPSKIAFFDSRVFTIPSAIEVKNYFIWRQNDCVRNSISSTAQSQYSHKELHGKNSNELQEMIFKRGINWNDYDSGYKRGRFIVKKETKNNRKRWTIITPEFKNENGSELDNILKFL